MRLRWLSAAAVVAGLGIADQPILARTPVPPTPTTDTARPRADHPLPHGYSTASVDTFVLAEYHWDFLTRDPQGWITVDRSPRPDSAFHVEDFSGMGGSWYAPISGMRSLWCGTRTRPDYPQCDANGCLPGYLNDWDQSFESVAFPRTGDVVVSFRARWDAEPTNDLSFLDYVDKDGRWTEAIALRGRGDVPIVVRIPSSDLPPTVKLRFGFASDGTDSDEDCLYLSDGAIIIDDVVVTDDTGVIDQQDFESEPVGALATADGDWFATYQTPYGDLAEILPGAVMLQQDPCVRVVSGVWTFIKGSVYTNACNGFPNYKVIPYGNADGLYLWNELWSPIMDWDQDSSGGSIPAAANGAILSFDVYRDMPLDALLFYQWHVRAFDPSGCPGAWHDRNYVYYGGQKDWLRANYEFGDLVPPGTEKIQVALVVRDMCEYWCGQIGEGCHAQAPFFGGVSIRRVLVTGPRWSIRDIDQFQDNFASDGTLTGTVRADMADDILPSNNFGILPGDSSVVSVNDPDVGLADDLALGGKKAYCYVSVLPPQAGKTGASLSGGPRWPFAGTETVDGDEWTRLRLDACIVDDNPVADKYCVDLNDNLFTPGDTIRFFYAAENTVGERTYAYGSSLSSQGGDVNAAAADPAEFTCLPAGGWNRGGDILYVDGMDGRGAQPYWDTAFAGLGLLGRIDRFDVRGPASGVGNRPAGRVQDPVQLTVPYRRIVWDSGDLETGLGNGSSYPEKTNDYALVNAFLAGLTAEGGIYVCGDDVLNVLNTYQSSGSPSGADAIAFKTTYLPYTLTTSNHRPAYGISPVCEAVAGGAFITDTRMIANGGCPLINDFDVVAPQGTTVNHMTYGAGSATSTNGAVIGNIVGDARVMFGGFGFAYITDDDANGSMDRADFLRDVLVWLGGDDSAPTPARSTGVNRLAQNYPNPFNPQTTIQFSLRQRGVARVVVYNVAGQQVRVLVDDTLTAGAHQLTWDGRNQAGDRVGSGVYFYRLTTDGFASTRKMVLLK